LLFRLAPKWYRKQIAFAFPSGRDPVKSLIFRVSRLPATERKFNAFLAEFQDVPPEKNKPHHHSGVEFLYLVSASLDIKVGNEDISLEAGDAIYFDSAVQHSYRRVGMRPCEGITITLPWGDERELKESCDV